MEAPHRASRPGHLRALYSSDSAWSKSARQCMAGVSCLRRSGNQDFYRCDIAGCIYNFGRMPDSAPSFQRHIQALRAAGVVIPPKPILELPRPIIEGQSPTGEQLAADAAYQRAITAWIGEVEGLYFQHFGVAER